MTASPPRPAGLPGDGQRIQVLDGLRSLVLLILFVHFTVEAARAWPGPLVAAYTLVGLVAVVALDVFFVLSGFLITGILLRSKSASAYFSSFYSRRFFRIFPLYFAFLLAYLVLLPRLPGWEAKAVALSPLEQLPYWAYYVNIGYALHWPLAAYTGHLWTLAIEEQFYLLWPVVVLVCSTRRLMWVCIAGLLLVPIVRASVAFAWPDTLLYYTFTPARADGLLLGSLIAIFWRDTTTADLFARRIRGAGVAALVVATGATGAMLLAPSLSLRGAPAELVFLTASVYCAGAAVVLMLQDSNRPWHRLARSWPLQRIGTYSYGIYVLHDPLAYVMDQIGVLHRPAAGDGLLETLIYFVVMSGLTIGVGALSWHCFEKPILGLGRLAAPTPRRGA